MDNKTVKKNVLCGSRGCLRAIGSLSLGCQGNTSLPVVHVCTRSVCSKHAGLLLSNIKTPPYRSVASSQIRYHKSCGFFCSIIMAKGHFSHNAPPDKWMRKIPKLILFSSLLTAIGGYSERSTNVYAPRSRAAERAIMSHLYGFLFTLAEVLMRAVFGGCWSARMLLSRRMEWVCRRVEICTPPRLQHEPRGSLGYAGAWQPDVW